MNKIFQYVLVTIFDNNTDKASKSEQVSVGHLITYDEDEVVQYIYDKHPICTTNNIVLKIFKSDGSSYTRLVLNAIPEIVETGDMFNLFRG